MTDRAWLSRLLQLPQLAAHAPVLPVGSALDGRDRDGRAGAGAGGPVEWANAAPFINLAGVEREMRGGGSSARRSPHR